MIWAMHCDSALIIETYLCGSLRFFLILLRLVVNNSDAQTNSLLAWDNCTFSIVLRFISDSDSLLFAIQVLYIETAKSKNRKICVKVYNTLIYFRYITFYITNRGGKLEFFALFRLFYSIFSQRITIFNYPY